MRRNSVALILGAIMVAGGACLIWYGGHWQRNVANKGRITMTVEDQDTAYHLHEDITATVFWVGEPADSSNDFIHNFSSAWADDWVAAFGGVDDPAKRCGYQPCGFVPKENPFYFALPYSDYTEQGIRPQIELQVIPWYTKPVGYGTSIIKNRWIEIRHRGRTAYAQWEDAGPFGENDTEYVFGTSRPLESRSGLDLSPAAADYLGVDGRATVDWRFVTSTQVPEGPWTKTITTSQPTY